MTGWVQRELRVAKREWNPKFQAMFDAVSRKSSRHQFGRNRGQYYFLDDSQYGHCAHGRRTPSAVSSHGRAKDPDPGKWTSSFITDCDHSGKVQNMHHCG